ncbi:MAG: L-seryl-tRNA(Sec) selenium transferase [Oscillospiraceae bacterium]|nr:L-seryl-tRNA(Sec) selenium transferase [Oscillospiraceae bacterium]
MNQTLLRQIPKVDDLLKLPALTALSEELSQNTVTQAVREVLESLRRDVLSGQTDVLPEADELCSRAAAIARRAALPSLRGVINGTGVILHTNLGRACISERAASAAFEAAKNYSTLEYNLATGSRGLRYSHVESLLCRLTGAESALVVNNNAAAVLLILSALAQDGEVITSRGELVEIGGSFRVPEIMEACGATLREVGATNKTKLRDYERAICDNTCALMKVHTSNYRIVGFTESPALADLVALGHAHGLPVIEDLGSGCLVNLELFGIHGEPTVQDSVRAGVDIISFSGDKLLGGPQAGIIIGKKEIMDKLKTHPLTRAMRVDKMTLAALEATLRSYEDERAMQEIPTLAMLSAQPEALRAKATALAAMIPGAVTVESECQVGGGSVPTQLLPSWAVALPGDAVALEQKLRCDEPPIIGRIHAGSYLLDARTLFEADFPYIAKAVKEALA